jgi:hypothetical protein
VGTSRNSTRRTYSLLSFAIASRHSAEEIVMPGPLDAVKKALQAYLDAHFADCEQPFHAMVSAHFI